MSGLVLSQLISELRIHTGVDSNDPDWTDTDCTLLINRTLWEIYTKFNFKETETSAQILTVASQREYPISADFNSLRLVAIIDNNSGAHSQLLPMTKDVYENSLVEVTTSNTQPTNYFRGDGSIILYPTPDIGYTIVVHYIKNLNDLSISNVNPPIGFEWHETILYGSVWRAFLRLSDPIRGNPFKSTYYGLITSMPTTEVKDMADRTMIGIEMPGRDY